MTTTLRAAAVQMTSGENKSENLAKAERLVRQAASAGARLIVLPEMFNLYGRPEAIVAAAESIPGATSELLQSWARELGATLVGGSFAEKSPRAGKVHNTSLLVGRDGRILAQYRKLHLFDIDLPEKQSQRESAWCLPGEEIVVSESDGCVIGQSICYDLRFPEVYRRLVDGGADVIVAPSAFTLATGRDHWEVLLRARAIENQCFVIAANQLGRGSADGPNCYGRSMIVDPWGVRLATAADEECWIAAELDFARLRAIRASLPALLHRRADLR